MPDTPNIPLEIARSFRSCRASTPSARGPTETRAFRRGFAASPDPAVAEATLTGWTAMKRLLKQSEIADAVFFLASPGATGITGEALVVDAGYALS